ncbi:MAG: hypothetical protein GXO16_00940 [Epsilonproteobacteria bacterium]|nr:hypothetical protein [Campylobacterota bacterium]
MAFFYLLLAVLLLFGMIGAIVYFFTDMTKQLKYTILSALVLGWILVAIYSYYQNQKRILIDKLYYEFSHGRVLECEAPFGERVKVDKNSFNFVSGTLVFVGKEGSSYEGLVVPIDSCKLE